MKKLRVSAMTALFVAALAMTGCKIFITGSNETDNGGNGGTKPVEKIVDAKEGDIILSDGTNISADKLADYKGTAKPAGVICKLNEDGKSGLMLGLKNDDKRVWALKDTTGCNTEFTEIFCTVEYMEDGSRTFEGDLDGSDNWAEICKVDTEGTKNPATNYPVFDYALNYAKTAGLEGTEYAEGWYVPSAYELYNYVYLNREELNAKLTAAGGTAFEKDNYWSSSQTNSTYYIYYGAWLVYFVNGGVERGTKSYDTYVCCLRAF